MYDICYAVNLQSRYATNHNKSLWFKMKVVLRYPKGSNSEITYRYRNNSKKNASEVIFWSEASFSDDLSTRKITIAYQVFWNNYAVVWNSSKTKSVTLSFTDSGFVPASKGLKTALFLRNTSQEVLFYNLSMKLCEDSQSSTKWLKNETVYQKKTTRIDVHYHFIRELYRENLMDIIYVPLKNQFADFLTKSLPSMTHEKLLQLFLGFSNSEKILNAMKSTMMGSTIFKVVWVKISTELDTASSE